MATLESDSLPNTHNFLALPDLRTLEIFLRVIECGGMTQAAINLELSQSAVSQSVANLEKIFGVQLLNRSTRPIQTTVYGEMVAERAKALLKCASALVADVRETSNSPLPRLRLGIANSLAATVGPELLISLKNQVSHCTVWSGLSTNHRDALVSYQLDMVLSADAFEDTPGLYRQEVLSEPFVLLVPENYPKPIENLAQLTQVGGLIRFSARSATGIQVERHLRRLRLKIPLSYEFDTDDAIIAMVENGIGWTITTPLSLLHSLTKLKKAQCLPLPHPSIKRHITLLCREDEFLHLRKKIANETQMIIINNLIPLLSALVPWLSEDFVLGNSEETKCLDI